MNRTATERLLLDGSRYQDFQLSPKPYALTGLRSIAGLLAEYDYQHAAPPLEMWASYRPTKRVQLSDDGVPTYLDPPAARWTFRELTFEQADFLKTDFPNGKLVTVRTRTAEPNVFSIAAAHVRIPALDYDRLPRINGRYCNLPMFSMEFVFYEAKVI